MVCAATAAAASVGQALRVGVETSINATPRRMFFSARVTIEQSPALQLFGLSFGRGILQAGDRKPL